MLLHKLRDYPASGGSVPSSVDQSVNSDGLPFRAPDNAFREVGVRRPKRPIARFSPKSEPAAPDLCPVKAH